MFIRRRTILAAAMALGLSGFITPATFAQEATPISFRLDWSIYGTHAPFYLAMQKGLYKDAGLDVTIGEGAGSATVSKLVAQGDDQIGFIDFGTMARGVEKGMPIKAVARVVSGVMCLISDADNPIKSPKDLSGKVVAFGPAESTGLVFPALLASQDVDPTTISIINPASGAKSALFLQGRADAIPGNFNVQVAQLEAKGKKVTYFPLSDYGIFQMNNGIVASTDFIKEHPDAVRSFVAATAKAFEMAEADPASAIDALIEVLPEQERNRDVLLRQLELTFPSLTTSTTTDMPFGMMTEEDWNETQKILVNYAGMPKAAKLEDLYTNEFISKK